jgi:hypothetical protein
MGGGGGREFTLHPPPPLSCAGFPYRSPAARASVTRMNRLVVGWTAGRVTWAAIAVLAANDTLVQAVAAQGDWLFALVTGTVFVVAELVPVLASLGSDVLRLLAHDQANDRDGRGGRRVQDENADTDAARPGERAGDDGEIGSALGEDGDSATGRRGGSADAGDGRDNVVAVRGASSDHVVVGALAGAVSMGGGIDLAPLPLGTLRRGGGGGGAGGSGGRGGSGGGVRGTGGYVPPELPSDAPVTASTATGGSGAASGGSHASGSSRSRTAASTGVSPVRPSAPGDGAGDGAAVAVSGGPTVRSTPLRAGGSHRDRDRTPAGSSGRPKMPGGTAAGVSGGGGGGGSGGAGGGDIPDMF